MSKSGNVALVATCSSNCAASNLWAIDLASGKRRDLRQRAIVVPFPDANSARWQVSLNGGRAPRWARNGKKLYFKSLKQELVAVPVTVGQIPVFGGRRVLFNLEREQLKGDPMQILYETDVDDSRFLFMRNVGSADGPCTILVQNWLPEVRMRLAAPR